MSGGTDRLGDLFQCVAQRSQVHVAVHAAELLAGLDHPGGAPAQRHLSVAPALTLPAWVRQIEIMLSTALVERSVRASVGGMPRRSTVRVSDMPSRRLAAAPGWVRSSSAASAHSSASAASAESA